MKKTATTPKYKADKKAKAKPVAPSQPAAPSPPMPKGDVVAVGAAKGRPMLQWVGKRPLRSVTAFPAQLVETFDPAHQIGDRPSSIGNLLFHGDNKEVLAHLLANGYRGKIDLVYIDPPFDSGADYVRKVSLRGKSATAKLDGEGYSLGEQTQYEDIWANDQYLQFMYERILLLRELLRPTGSIFLHCDWRRVHYLRCILDEVFGTNEDAFINELIWVHQIMGGSHDKRFPKAHETILWCSRGESRLRFEDPHVRVPFSEYVLKTMQKDEEGRWYYERRRMSRKATAAEAASKAHTRTYIDDPEKGTVATDVWDDFPSYQEVSSERDGAELYPTQKTKRLLRRVVAAASDPGDVVLDCFAGAGTAVVVAQELGRRWIGCDINKGAVQTTSKRLQGTIREQIEEKRKREAQGELIKAEDPPPEPAALSFAVYRVNDYDLQIQHNEAVALACEHIGVTRSRTDGFFDGTQGKRLVKIVPFNHPLSPLDLEEVVRELKARKNEERDILLVCLGKELAADAWIEHYNQMRKKGSVPNKIEVIELRTDPKYGKFIAHKPASAKVAIRRKGSEIHVEIQDFISPGILERLETQADLLTPQIKDWRAMVDCVMIDTVFDGAVFSIALGDIPEKKADFVEGAYTLPAPEGETTVAVKIIDMLGEEVVVTRKV